MPTTYTAPIADGEISELRDFGLRCALAFMPLICFRDRPFDEPIPEKIECDTSYHDMRISELEAELAKLTAMSAEEVATAATAEMEATKQRYREMEESDAALIVRYADMTAKVEAWNPPEPYIGLKKFMQGQIAVSSRQLEFRPLDLPEFVLGEEWRIASSAILSADLKRQRQRRQETIDRAAENQKWLDGLRAALPPTNTIVGARS